MHLFNGKNIIQVKDFDLHLVAVAKDNIDPTATFIVILSTNHGGDYALHHNIDDYNQALDHYISACRMVDANLDVVIGMNVNIDLLLSKGTLDKGNYCHFKDAVPVKIAPGSPPILQAAPPVSAAVEEAVVPEKQAE